MGSLTIMNPDIKLNPEPESHEFGNYFLDSFPIVQSVTKKETVVNMNDNAIPIQDINLDINICNTQMHHL